jgi:hypothetical protein
VGTVRGQSTVQQEHEAGFMDINEGDKKQQYAQMSQVCRFPNDTQQFLINVIKNKG